MPKQLVKTFTYFDCIAVGVCDLIFFLLLLRTQFANSADNFIFLMTGVSD